MGAYRDMRLFDPTFTAADFFGAVHAKPEFHFNHLLSGVRNCTSPQLGRLSWVSKDTTAVRRRWPEHNPRRVNSTASLFFGGC